MRSISQEAAVQGALYRNEVGIEFGVLDDLQVKTAHRPVYGRRDDQLVPVAMQADLRLQRRAHPVPTDHALTPADPQRCAMIWMAWHRLVPRNHVTHGTPGLDLQAMIRVRRAGTAIDAVTETLAVLAEAHASGLDPQALQIDLADVHASDPQRLNAVSLVVSMAGARLVLDLTSASLLAAKPDAQTRPDIVRISARRFHAACREGAQADRLRDAVVELRRRGTTVQIDGIQSRRQFCKALALRADLFSGDYLGPCMLAGMAFDDEPRSLSALLREEGNVLRLFA